MLSTGERFADYVVDAALGRGGYAAVYRAHDASERVVALKVLDEAHRHPAALARLRREIEFARQLHHPNIVTVYDSGPGWLAMELLDGGTVLAVPTLDGRLTALAQIADALDYTHQHGIVHCDVKPSNILVSQDFSRAVLIDFGVAYAVAERSLPQRVEASLPYSAPEMLRGHFPTAATDEYALACTAVELVTGAPPFRVDSSLKLTYAQLYDQPPRFSESLSWLPRAFDSKIAKAMAKDPEVRYPTCTEFVAALTRVLR
ncbi:serine/threonine-protein kinase [Mycobacterium hubeiense]|uniref:serine/threonine-protein kinase n=1 Tax=Mycobacterium hubeiense TaxID=1867256 RepID=UPI000C7F6A7B|nr:serine/threonine-protein kinase [Mycobacterium sp. QGD 101]